MQRVISSQTLRICGFWVLNPKWDININPSPDLGTVIGKEAEKKL